MKALKHLGAAAAVTVAVAVAVAASASAQTVMKLANATVNDVQHEWQKVFAAELTKRVGDKVKPQIYPASQLGAIPAMVEGTLLGTIEAFITPTSFLVSSDPRLMVFDAPGLFQSPRHVVAVLHDPAYRNHLETMVVSRGLRINGVMFGAPTAVLTKKPSRTLADLKGLKIRTFASPLQIEPMKSLGVNPIPMALSEVMGQLQSGGIDGLLAGITVLVPFKFYDAAKYVTELDFAPVISINVVNEKWYQAQPKDVQAAISEAGRAAEAQMFAWNMPNIERSNKAWLDNKGEILKLPADEYAGMMKSFREIGTKIIADNAGAKAEFEKLVAVVNAKASK